MDAAHAQYARYPYLHFPKKHQRWLKPFLDFAAEDANGLPLAAWISERYTPERLKAWPETHGMAATHGGIFLAPTRSPFQW